MTSLLFSDKELCLTRKFIDEAYRLFGIDCNLYEVTSMNMYLDDRVLQTPVSYKILLQEYVDTRLLANLRWSTVDLDRESIMAISPIVYCNKRFNLKEFNVIRLANGDCYQIREVNSTYLLNTHYVLKLITYNEEKNRPREEKEMRTNFMTPTRIEFE